MLSFSVFTILYFIVALVKILAFILPTQITIHRGIQAKPTSPKWDKYKPLLVALYFITHTEDVIKKLQLGLQFLKPCFKTQSKT